MRFRSPQELSQVDEKNGKPDCDQQGGLVRSFSQEMKGNPFNQNSEKPAGEDGCNHPHPERSMEVFHDRIAGKGSCHKNFSMGKGDKPEGPKDDRKTQGNEGIYSPLGHPVNNLFK